MKKADILTYLQKHLSEQLEDYIDELNSTNEEIGKETKSSAGDKFETSREMMNQEISRIEERIAYLKKQLNAVQQLTSIRSKIVSNGSLVTTNHGFFFFGVAVGKLSINNEPLIGLSFNSPLGKAMSNQKEGDSITFMNRVYVIEKIN